MSADQRPLQAAEELAPRPMTDSEYDRLRTLIHERTGINLGPAKRELLAARLARRLRELGLRSYGEYYARLIRGDPAEHIRLFDAISTNETHFFREPKQFEFLTDVVVPRWERLAAEGRMPRRIRIWSAACATGEEVYSLAMVAAERLPAAAGWDVEILATDLSARALEAARRAVWPIEKGERIPEKYLKSYMLRGIASQQGNMKAGAVLRGLVRFARVNLNDEVYPVGGPFHLIFCRNVLIYFDAASRRRVLNRLAGYLAPGAYLVLGQVESASGLTDRLRAVGPAVYARPAAAAAEDIPADSAGPFRTEEAA